MYSCRLCASSNYPFRLQRTSCSRVTHVSVTFSHMTHFGFWGGGQAGWLCLTQPCLHDGMGCERACQRQHISAFSMRVSSARGFSSTQGSHSGLGHFLVSGSTSCIAICTCMCGLTWLQPRCLVRQPARADACIYQQGRAALPAL